jgi:HEAT repeat protein
MMDIPHEQIRQTEDRSWTMRLLDEIAHGHLEDFDNLIETLSQLDDYRAEPRLRELLLSKHTPGAVRQAASDVLFRVTAFDTAEERARWWQSGDEVLMRHSIRMAERSEKDLILKIGAQLHHPFFLDVVRKLDFWEEPHYQNILIRALTHELPEVRQAAASGLKWEQPAAAELPLLALASDTNDDVAIAALDTLIWCAGCELLLGLEDLKKNGRDSVHDNYEITFDCMKNEFLYQVAPEWLDEGSTLPISRYLQSVRHLIQSEISARKNEVEDEKHNAQSGVQAVQEDSIKLMSAQEIIDDLSDADGEWNQKWRRYLNYKEWHLIDGNERKTLSEFLINHADPTVREVGCHASSAWLDEEALLYFMNDQSYTVRKIAAYGCEDLPPSVPVRKKLLGLLSDPETTNAFAQEVLQSYSHHSQQFSLDGFWCDLAVNDARPSVRTSAARKISENCALSLLKPVIALLSGPPVNDWGLHKTILMCLENHHIPTSAVSQLYSVDDLGLQETLARIY